MVGLKDFRYLRLSKDSLILVGKLSDLPSKTLLKSDLYEYARDSDRDVAASRSKSKGKITRVNGINAIEYNYAKESSAGIYGNILYLFADQGAYTIECRYALPEREKITAACDQVTKTLRETK